MARSSTSAAGEGFEQLPEMQRLTLELFYFEGLDLREISNKLTSP